MSHYGNHHNTNCERLFATFGGNKPHMTRKQALEFLTDKKNQIDPQFGNVLSPHAAIKWLRVIQHYTKLLFGEDSEVYRISKEQSVPDVQSATYDSEITVLQTRMTWLLDDCIDIVNSGAVDEKFDKNLFYKFTTEGVITFSITTGLAILALGMTVGTQLADSNVTLTIPKEIKLSTSARVDKGYKVENKQYQNDSNSNSAKNQK